MQWYMKSDTKTTEAGVPQRSVSHSHFLRVETRTDTQAHVDSYSEVINASCNSYYFLAVSSMFKRRDSSVDSATVYELDGWGSIPYRGNIFLSSPQRSERL